MSPQEMAVAVAVGIYGPIVGVIALLGIAIVAGGMVISVAELFAVLFDVAFGESFRRAARERSTRILADAEAKKVAQREADREAWKVKLAEYQRIAKGDDRLGRGTLVLVYEGKFIPINGVVMTPGVWESSPDLAEKLERSDNGAVLGAKDYLN